MINRVFSNPDRIMIVLVFMVLGLIILSWFAHEVEVKKGLKVVENA